VVNGIEWDRLNESFRDNLIRRKFNRNPNFDEVITMKENTSKSEKHQEKSSSQRGRAVFTSFASLLREKFQNSMGLPFAAVLPESELEKTLKEEGISYRKRLFCPIVTLWGWLSQVLDPDKSCKKAVSRVVAYLIDLGQPLPSTDTGAYCKARKRLAVNWLLGLVRKTGNQLHQVSEPHWLWCGRRVAVVDGSTLLMADTPQNQAPFPQHKKQAKGCGFPIARIAALFGLATGGVLDAAISALSIGEVNLFRGFFKRLLPGDVVIGEAMFGSYADIALLLATGVDSGFRLHSRRKTDFRRGKRLGRYDHIVSWQKPKQCPAGLCRRKFDTLPEPLMVREVRFQVSDPGFRTRQVTLVTTLLDAKAYPKAALAALYRERWQAEISLRHLKTRLQMEFLTSKTPDMVKKEFYVHLLAYNLIRSVQKQAAEQHGGKPTLLSFAATVQHVAIFSTLIASAINGRRHQLYLLLLVLVATEQLHCRPNRYEPRVKKRRPKPYRWMKKPRKDYHRQQQKS